MGNVCITIDGGTTNTRCLIWDQEARVIASCKCNIGARNGACLLYTSDAADE